jgi:hypothetical protein
MYVTKTTRSEKAAVSQKDAQATASTASRPIDTARRQTASSKKKDRATAAYSPGRESSGDVMTRKEASSSEADPNTPMLNVKTDSPLFRSNSANSPVVTSLKKGDNVRSGGLEIIDSQGTWTLVRRNGRFGFVPSDLLEPNTLAQEAQK